MILLLLFVTCLVTVTNLMLVIMKEQRGAGAGGHPERGFRGFLWGFCFFLFSFLFSVFFEWLRVFSVPFFRAHSLDGGPACKWNPAFVTVHVPDHSLITWLIMH